MRYVPVTGTKEEVKIMNENKDKIYDDADSRKNYIKKIYCLNLKDIVKRR